VIKIGVKGKINKGKYAPNGEVLLKGADEVRPGSFYLYVWPNDGTKWPESEEEMVYDNWMEDWSWVEEHFKNRKWEIQWYDEKPSSDKLVENPDPPSSSES
jgi:hypothetical protein